MAKLSTATLDEQLAAIDWLTFSQCVSVERAHLPGATDMARATLTLARRLNERAPIEGSLIEAIAFELGWTSIADLHLLAGWLTEPIKELIDRGMLIRGETWVVR